MALVEKAFLQRSVDIWLQLRDAFLIQNEYPVKICSPIGPALGRACISQGHYKQRCTLLGEMFNNHHVVSVQIVVVRDQRIALMSCSGFRRNQKKNREGP